MLIQDIFQSHNYTPGIYAKGYTVLYVRSCIHHVHGIYPVSGARGSFVHPSRSWNLPQSSPPSWVKVFQMGYISESIFGPWVPWKVCFNAMSFGPRWGWRSKSRTPLKSVFLPFLWKQLAQIVGQTLLSIVTLTCRS